jgi:hypothetical protein
MQSKSIPATSLAVFYFEEKSCVTLTVRRRQIIKLIADLSDNLPYLGK